MALECLKSVPAAAVGLFRAALEVEINSLVNQYEASSKGKGISALRRQGLGERISDLIERLRSKGILGDEDLEDFEACCALIRLEGNRILHPRGGLPRTDAQLVAALSHSFRRIAEISTRAKEAL